MSLFSRIWFPFLLALLVALPQVKATAAVVYNSSNGHYYEMVSANLNWDDAKAAAQARTYLGTSGHLVTITSQAEEDFINSNFGGTFFWVGGVQAPGSVEPAGGFGWVTGEPFVYTDWNSGEPNNGAPDNNGSEDVIQRTSNNHWNDVPRTFLVSTYLAEYDVAPSTTLPHNTTNGHFYELVSANLNWDDAKAAAQSRSYLGVPGHLATITSQSEENYINTNFSGITFWLGALQAPGSVEPAGGFGWVTGEPFVYTDWNSGEPNNINGTEDTIQHNSSNHWNDVPRATLASSYLVEYDVTVPEVLSVSPSGANDPVGAKRTFALTVSDPNGAGDISNAWLLINTRLDWSAGATLIYEPSAGSPTDGQLLLRQGDNFLPPIQVGSGASSSAVLDNGAVRVVATDVTITTNGNALTVTLPLTIRDGLVGHNILFGRAEDRNGQVDPDSQAGDSGFVSEGSYIVTPQFNGATNRAPTLSKLTPGATNTTLNGSGLAPAAQNFGFFVQDADGIGDIDSVWFLANKTRGWNNSATFVYYPRTRRLVLRSDDGNSFLGGGQIGSPGIIENSQVRVDLSKVKVSILGDGKSFGLTLPLQAKTGLVGNNGVWLRVQDNTGITSPDGDDLGFVLKGNWNVKAATAPRDTKPSNGNS